MRPHQHPRSPEEPPDPLAALLWFEGAARQESEQAEVVARIERTAPDPQVRELARLQAASHHRAAAGYAMIAGLLVPRKPWWQRGLAWVKKILKK